jgi:hypothetical protein
MKPATRAVTALLLLVTALAAGERPRGEFPHLAHERLFPVCVGCHVAAAGGAAEHVFPSPELCARCHDGGRAPTVVWGAPGSRPSNLEFEHAAHAARLKAAGEPADCQHCHAGEGPRSRMNVGRARAELCLECHANAAGTHLAADANCGVCHLPLERATRLSARRVEGFPRPATHAATDFLSAHASAASGGSTSCSVCHARQSCERCHANAERVPEIAALPRDPRIASLVAGRPAEYPLPASHRIGEWGITHGSEARAQPGRCANCHTRPSCAACHGAASGGAAAVLASLPLPRRGEPAGVAVRTGGDIPHPGGFVARHGAAASTGALRCSACHTQQSCAECHAGTDSRAFHPRNFVERHAREVFAGAGDCQSCHTQETFCRACHTSTGLASDGSMRAAFHTGQALWVLSHGPAARRGLASCTSCHAQRDCLQCHSSLGGWGVNPHGSDFRAERLGRRAQATCRVCHFARVGRE